MIFVSFFIWHYTLGLSYAFSGAIDFVKGVFRYFSVSYLLMSLFSPWHSITQGYGRGFALGEYLLILLGNLLSRVLGAIVRTFVIAVGLVVTVFSVVLAVVFVVFWILMPLVILFFFIAGIALLFPR